MRLYVRAGSIVPFGPVLQYATEKPEDPIELRVYCGADGKFTIHEDEGNNYNCERGKYARIPIIWNEATRTLVIGKRVGKFTGMLKQRTFYIVWVSSNHGIGSSSTEKPDAVIHYSGGAVKISRP